MLWKVNWDREAVLRFRCAENNARNAEILTELLKMECADVGMNAHISKPIEMRVLKKTIRNVKFGGGGEMQVPEQRTQNR